jgi:hypothetical protein
MSHNKQLSLKYSRPVPAILDSEEAISVCLDLQAFGQQPAVRAGSRGEQGGPVHGSTHVKK